MVAGCTPVGVPTGWHSGGNAAGVSAGLIGSPNAEEKRQGDAMTGSAKVYELRIYHVVPGKLDSLVARFRDYTDKLFAKHGMKRVAYWTALDEPVKSSTFFYILEHPSREAAAANWKVFQEDLEWKTVKAKSEENGKLVEKIDSTFLTLTDFPRRHGSEISRPADFDLLGALHRSPCLDDVLAKQQSGSWPKAFLRRESCHSCSNLN